MSLPKWAVPVGVVVGLLALLLLSSREPKSPDGLPIIDTAQELRSTVDEAGAIVMPIITAAEAGAEVTPTDKEKLLKAAVMLDNAARFAPTSTNIYIGAAQAYFYADQIDLAEARIRMAIANNEHDKDASMKQSLKAEAFYVLSLIRFKVGDYEDALEKAKMASDINPTVPNYFSAEASALIQLKRMEEADKVLHEALSIEPEHVRSNQLHGLVKVAH